MAVNFTGAFLTIREGIRVLRAQGLGGNIVINSSKNVFGPGKDFGAYSASKAAGHQLGKVSAIELAAEGIRVNMINADAIFAEDDVERRTPGTMVLLVRFASGLSTAHRVGTRADGFAAMALGDPYQKYHRRQGTNTS